MGSRSTLLAAAVFTLVLTVSSAELYFGKGFEAKLAEDLKKGLEDFNKITNESMSQISGMLDQFKTDFIPDMTDEQKTSTETCIQFGKNLAKKFWPAKVACLKELRGGKSRKRRAIAPCFGKCVGIKLTILNEDGTPNVPNAKALVDEVVPKTYMDLVTSVVEKCGETIAAIKKDDEKCESHRMAIKCIGNGMSDISMDIFKRCPDIPNGWKKLVEAVAANTKNTDTETQ